MANEMKEIVDWLRTVEELAHKLYSHSREFFANDGQLSAFLQDLANDEAWHYHLMGSASEFIAQNNISVISAIELDPVTISRVEKPLKEAYDLLSLGTLSQRQCIESMVHAESSEWNILFLYSINSLKSFSKLFEHGASVVQSHQNCIEQFLGAHPDGLRYVDSIRQLPAVWKPRFLVVEDDHLLRGLISELLEARGTVETSPNGKEALEKTKRHFFDVIVSDIGMPTMNGMDFFREAIKEDPFMGRHFVFCSGEIGPDQERFFRENQLPHLKKPFKVNDLMEIIQHILGA